jgi:hypothetical protein
MVYIVATAMLKAAAGATLGYIAHLYYILLETIVAFDAELALASRAANTI